MKPSSIAIPAVALAIVLLAAGMSMPAVVHPDLVATPVDAGNASLAGLLALCPQWSGPVSGSSPQPDNPPAAVAPAQTVCATSDGAGDQSAYVVQSYSIATGNAVAVSTGSEGEPVVITPAPGVSVIVDNGLNISAGGIDLTIAIP